MTNSNKKWPNFKKTNANVGENFKKALNFSWQASFQVPLVGKTTRHVRANQKPSYVPAFLTGISRSLLRFRAFGSTVRQAPRELGHLAIPINFLPSGKNQSAKASFEPGTSRPQVLCSPVGFVPAFMKGISRSPLWFRGYTALASTVRQALLHWAEITGL